MGYDLHITRAEKWVESRSNQILLDEWCELVKKDSEMNMHKIATVTTSLGESICYYNEGLAAWYPEPNNRNNKVWFDYREGRIVVKNPDAGVLKKAKEIASLLGARVFGDEGEEYP